MHKQFPAARLLAATFAAALMQPVLAAEPAAVELAPLDVSNLYIKTIINQDEASVAKLNAYLRPTRLAGHQSAEYASYSGLKEADSKFPTETGKLIADLFPAAMRAALTPAAELLAANVIAAKNGAACLATKAGGAQIGVEFGDAGFILVDDGLDVQIGDVQRRQFHGVGGHGGLRQRHGGGKGGCQQGSA